MTTMELNRHISFSGRSVSNPYKIKLKGVSKPIRLIARTSIRNSPDRIRNGYVDWRTGESVMRIHPLIWFLAILLTVQVTAVTPLVLTLLKMQGYL